MATMNFNEASRKQTQLQCLNCNTRTDNVLMSLGRLGKFGRNCRDHNAQNR